ncbi:MAG: efflux RND transporter periplasmic adaptor subunit [Tissierellia bacterium]|nr:efflux RND transporter periplasmic adaptor subunit [Tissierellia bacterium]
MKKIFKRKKILIILLVIIAGVFVFLGLNKNNKDPLAIANVMKLEIKTIEENISVKSTLDGIEKAEVVSPLNYEIIDIKVKEGDVVSKDQVLAVLDSEELKKQIAEAENQIELTNLELMEKLRKMQIEYDNSLSNITDLEKSYEQNKELYNNGIITEEALKTIEKSVSDAKKAIASYNAVDGKIVLTQSEEKNIEIQKQKLEQKKEDLDKIYIKSPINGTVTRVNVNLGRYANETDDRKAMFVVENLEHLQMKVYINEFDIAKIKIGQEVEIYSDILGQDFVKGEISRISPTAEQKDSNNMERVIPVLIEVKEKHDNLIAGVLATAKIKVDKAENIFAVPTGALVSDENMNYKIFILNNDNSLKSIPVEVGLETDLESEISSHELTEGMKVIVNPDMTFTDGMVINPNEEQV